MESAKVVARNSQTRLDVRGGIVEAPKVQAALRAIPLLTLKRELYSMRIADLFLLPKEFNRV